MQPCKVAFFILTVTAGVVCVAPAPPPFRNPLHVFQHFAHSLYPNDADSQKKAVVTPKYLFRNPEWAKRQHCEPIPPSL